MRNLPLSVSVCQLWCDAGMRDLPTDPDVLDQRTKELVDALPETHWLRQRLHFRGRHYEEMPSILADLVALSLLEPAQAGYAIVVSHHALRATLQNVRNLQAKAPLAVA